MTIGLQEFFNILWRDCDADSYACMRLIPEGDNGYPENVYRAISHMHNLSADSFRWLAERNHSHHIYHRVSVSATMRDRKSSITQVPALWCDVDDDSDEAFARLDNLCPTAIIASGGGYHGYWLLHEPIRVDDDETREQVERTLQGLALASGGDTSVTNINRILRTPLTMNIKAKYDEPKQAKIVYCDDQWGRWFWRVLKRDYMSMGAPPRPKVKRHVPSAALTDDLTPFAKWYLKNGHLTGRGERNKQLFGAASDYHSAGRSITQAENDLAPIALSTGLSQGEITKTIQSAYRGARKPNINNPMIARYAIGDQLS